MSDAFELNDRNLNQLIKALSGNMPVAKLGVIGSKKRKDSVDTNAAIGAKHEFGADGMPIRSWLRMPLTDYYQKYLDKADTFTEETLKEILKTRSFVPFVEKLAIVGEGIIADGFDTGGFGKWPKWSGGYTNNTGSVLVDTQQLRNSVTSEVK